MTPDQKIPSCIKKNYPLRSDTSPQRNNCPPRTHQQARRDDVTPDAHGPTAVFNGSPARIVLFPYAAILFKCPSVKTEPRLNSGNSQKQQKKLPHSFTNSAKQEAS